MNRAYRLNRLLFHLAGRVDDEELALLRSAVADAEDDLDTERIADSVLLAFARGALDLTPEELGLVLEEAERVLDEIPAGRLLEEPPLPARFFPPSPSDLVLPPSLLLGRVARTSRAGREDGVDVWLVETYADAEPVQLTADLQQALAEQGEIPPRVEVFAPWEHLPPYHRAALDVAR